MSNIFDSYDEPSILDIARRAMAECGLSTSATSIPAAEAPTVNVQLSKDGYWVDGDSGEVLGYEELESFEEITARLQGKEVPEVRKPFVVEDVPTAEWVLSKMQEEDSINIGLMARKAAIIANIDTQIKAHKNRLAFLHNRFDADLQMVARNELKGQKTKTLVTPFGKMSFRKTGGGISVLNTAAALEWAEKHAPEAVQITKSVIVTPLKGKEKNLPGDIFEVRGPSESFKIDTGV